MLNQSARLTPDALLDFDSKRRGLSKGSRAVGLHAELSGTVSVINVDGEYRPRVEGVLPTGTTSPAGDGLAV